MKKVCLFMISLLVLVTVGCATSQKASYRVEVPPENLEEFAEIYVFISSGIMRGMLDAQNPDLLEITQNAITYFQHSAWDDALAESLQQKYETHFSKMGVVEFAVKVQELHNDMDRIRQVCAMLAQEVSQQAQLTAQRRNAQVAQFNQATSTQIQIPNFQVPNIQIPTPSLNMNPLGNPSSSGYMINTDQGLKHGNCTTLPSGMVYCQ